MKKTTHLSLIIFLLIFLSSESVWSEPIYHAELVNTVLDTLPDENFGEPIEITREKGQEVNPFATKASEVSKVIPVSSITTDSTFVQLLKIPGDYSGFRIEIFNSSAPLESDHEIFFQHGNLSMEKIKKSSYSYTLGNFSNQDEATVFMQDFLLQRYPDARVIEYEEGKRLF